MTIERNGEIIELTQNELYLAYQEARHEIDKDDIAYFVEWLDSDDPRRKEFENPEFMADVAFRYRKYMDDDINEDAMYQCIIDAYNYVKRDWPETSESSGDNNGNDVSW